MRGGEARSRPEALFGGALGLLLAFAAAAKGGHDLWAAAAAHLMALAYLCALAFWSSRSAKAPAFSLEPLLPALLPLSALWLSYRGAANPGEAFSELADWAVVLSLFWGAAAVLRSEEALDAFLAAIVPLLWLELVLIFCQRVDNFLNPPPLAYPGWYGQLMYALSAQMPATFTNANAAAGFCLAWTPVLADRALRARKAGRGAGFWASGFWTALACVLLLNTLWGLACAGAALLLLLRRPVLEQVRRRPRLAAALLGGGALLLAGGAAWKLLHRLDWTGNAPPAHWNTSRLTWWLTGWRMFTDHPWLGVGPGNFGSAFLAYKAGAGQNTLFAHSFPVGFLAETGLAGAGALAAFLAWAVRKGWKGREPYLLGFAACAAFSLLSLNLEYLANLMLAALLLAAAAAPALRASWKPGILAPAVFLAAGLAAAPYLLAPLQASRLATGAWLSLKEGKVEEARRAFAAAAELDPRSWEAELGLSRVLLALGDASGAREHARRALALNRLHPGLSGEAAPNPGP